VATAADNLTLHRYPSTNTGYVEKLADGVELTMMQIPSGKFLMGSSDDDPEGQANERPQHEVTVPRFFMANTPVTQSQWRVVAVMPQIDLELTPDPSGFKVDDLPVESVSWNQATEFCQRLSVKTGLDYRLPSEAEWEYACRAETEAAYHFGPQITNELANYQGQQTTAVKTYPPNRWGLYDMHGNVWEWCEDDYHGSYEDAPKDGSAWVNPDRSKAKRILRGGSWIFNPRYCRSAYRSDDEPDYRFNSIGFRVVCAAPRTL
jgi:formylglycine-generating enzyme required for sulfatase activity